MVRIGIVEGLCGALFLAWALISGIFSNLWEEAVISRDCHQKDLCAQGHILTPALSRPPPPTLHLILFIVWLWFNGALELSRVSVLV